MKLKVEQGELREMLQDLHRITGFRFVIFDEEFRKLMAYPEESCAFCEAMKAHPVSRQLCRDTDRRACQCCRESHQVYLYRCHAGLIEAVTPLRINDLTAGYIMFGQIRKADAPREPIFCYAERFIPNKEMLHDAVDALAVRDEAQIRSVARLVEACAGYLWAAELLKIDEGNLAYRLSQYIDGNLRGDLSVEKLCAVLSISRTRIYELAHEYLGDSIAHYIRGKRAACAASALQAGARVSEAAEAGGFTDYNYFSKIFRRVYGVTPREYRRRYESQL